MVTCPYCGSTKKTKDGKRRTKYYGWKQTYRCGSCRRKYTPHPAAGPTVEEKRLITHLVWNGETSRRIAKELERQTGRKVTYATICNWINKYRLDVEAKRISDDERGE